MLAFFGNFIQPEEWAFSYLPSTGVLPYFYFMRNARDVYQATPPTCTTFLYGPDWGIATGAYKYFGFARAMERSWEVSFKANSEWRPSSWLRVGFATDTSLHDDTRRSQSLDFSINNVWGLHFMTKNTATEICYKGLPYFSWTRMIGSNKAVGVEFSRRYHPGSLEYGYFISNPGVSETTFTYSRTQGVGVTHMHLFTNQLRVAGTMKVKLTEVKELSAGVALNVNNLGPLHMIRLSVSKDGVSALNLRGILDAFYFSFTLGYDTVRQSGITSIELRSINLPKENAQTHVNTYFSIYGTNNTPEQPSKKKSFA